MHEGKQGERIGLGAEVEGKVERERGGQGGGTEGRGKGVEGAGKREKRGERMEGREGREVEGGKGEQQG